MSVPQRLVCTAILFIAAVAPACSQRESAGIPKAQAYIDKGELSSAAITLKNALTHNPDSQQARLLLGEVQFALGDGASAEKELTRARQLGSADAVVMPLLAQSLLLQGKTRELLALPIAAELPADARADLLVSRVLALLAQRDVSKAAEQLALAVAEGVPSPYLNLAKAHVATAQGNTDQAVAILRAETQEHPGYSYAWSALGDVLEYIGNLREAETAYTHAVESGVTDGIDRLKLAKVRMAQQKYDAAADDLSRLRQPYQDNPQALLLRGTLAFVRGRYADAVPLLEQVLEVDPNQPAALFYLGASHFKQGEYESALRLLQLYNKRMPENAAARAMLGTIAAKLGLKAPPVDSDTLSIEETVVREVKGLLDAQAYDQALAAANRYRDSHPTDIGGEILMGLVHMQRQEPHAAEAAYLKALTLEPGNISANSGLAALALASRRLDDAKARYLDALKVHPGDLRTLINLAAVENAQGDSEAMVDALSSAIEHNPNALDPKILLGRYYVKARQPDKALALLAEARKSNPDNRDLLELVGEAEFAARNYEAARDAFVRLAAQTPDDAEVHFKLAQAFGRLNANKELRAELIRSIGLNPEHANARLLLAKHYAALGEFDAAEEQLSWLKKNDQVAPDILRLDALLAKHAGDKPREEQALAKLFERQPNNFNLLGLANAQWEQGKHDAAVAALEDWLKEHPEDTLTLLELGNRYLSSDKNEQALECFERLLKLDSNNVIGLNNLAWLLKDSQQAEALRYAERAITLAPESALVIDTLAMVYLGNGDVVQAKALIDRALQKQPKNPSYLFHKAVIAESSGDAQHAVHSLQQALALGTDFPEKQAAQEMLRRLRGS